MWILDSHLSTLLSYFSCFCGCFVMNFRLYSYRSMPHYSIAMGEITFIFYLIVLAIVLIHGNLLV